MSITPLMDGENENYNRQTKTPEQAVAKSFVEMFTQDAADAIIAGIPAKTPQVSQMLQDAQVYGFDPPAGAARDESVTPLVVESEQQPLILDDQARCKEEIPAADAARALDELSPRSEILPLSARTDFTDNVTPRGRGRLITKSMILRSTKAMRYRKESDEGYLARITHLHLQSKRLRNLENLDACVGLKVIYANDNLITEMPRFQSQRHLTHLYLMDNAIRFMTYGQELESLPSSLICLKLDQNEISYVENLSPLKHLETLSVANQRCPSGAPPLKFDLDSLSSVGSTLMNLNISGNGIMELMPIIHPLPHLKRLNAAKNKLRNIDELRSCIRMLEELKECDFRKNPVCSHRKYTRLILAASLPMLTLLDGEPVISEHREKLVAIEEHRALVKHRVPKAFQHLPAPSPGLENSKNITIDGMHTDHKLR